jgi:hypothetical protein
VPGVHALQVGLVVARNFGYRLDIQVHKPHLQGSGSPQGRAHGQNLG